MPSRFLRVLPFLLFLSLGFPSTLPAQNSTNAAVVTALSGKVTVKRNSKNVTLHKDSKVRQGETLMTARDSTATLRFFDGSELKVRPETRFILSRVEKIGATDKVLKFKLLLGKLFASVQKLSSSRSSFEVEAGGVVCGVRGTQYEVGYDGQSQVDLFVQEGNVWAQAGGNTFQYGPGGAGHFSNGHPNNPAGGGDHGNKDKKGKGNQPPGPPDAQGNHSDPFQGMGGNHNDPLQPLTGGNSDTGTIGDKTGDANLQGLGAHTVILQLKYPEQ